MDRSKWEYKKLGDICEVLDKLRKPVTKSDRVTGQYPYYGATGIQDYVADYIFDGRYLLLGEDGAKWGANDKSAFIIEGKSWVNNHAHILKIKEDYMDVFVMYYLNHKDLSEYITGAVVPKLTQAAMNKIPIPAVSFSDQQRIVAELDCLNEMIALKQEQLKEFDKLAQSIFYDMFGDLSINNKSWKIRPFVEIATAKTGITYKPDNVKDSGTIVLRSSNIQGDELVFEDVVRVDLPISDKYYVQNGDILMCSRNGSARLVGKTAKIMNVNEIMTWGAFMTIIRSKYNDYLLQYFKTDTFRNSLASSKTTTVHQITIGMLNALKIPLPPLELQQQFAEKIQAIEAQKELVKQSIAETQKLLDYTMDYYFND